MDNFLLTSECCRDRFMVFNLNDSDMEKIFNRLNSKIKKIVPITIKLTKYDEELISTMSDKFYYEKAKQIIASTYLTSKLIKDLQDKIPSIKEKYDYIYNVDNILENFKINDESFLINGDNFPLPYNLNLKSIDGYKFDINIFLYNITNNYLQVAVNEYISRQDPWSVKIFTRESNLSTYQTLDNFPLKAYKDYKLIDGKKLNFDDLQNNFGI